jgi:hypothetical protein
VSRSLAQTAVAEANNETVVKEVEVEQALRIFRVLTKKLRVAARGDVADAGVAGV